MTVLLPDHLDPPPPLTFQPRQLAELAGRYVGYGGALHDLSGRLAAGAGTPWQGPAADTFTRMLRALTGHLTTASDALTELGAALRTLAAELELAVRAQGNAERDMRDLDRQQLQPLRRQAGPGADEAEIRRFWEQIRTRQSAIADDAYRARVYAASALQKFRRTLTAAAEASYRTLPPSFTGDPDAASDHRLLSGTRYGPPDPDAGWVAWLPPGFGPPADDPDRPPGGPPVDVDELLRDLAPLAEQAAATARRYRQDLAGRAAGGVGPRRGDSVRVPFRTAWVTLEPVRYALTGHVEATRARAGEPRVAAHYVVCVHTLDRAGRGASTPRSA